MILLREQKQHPCKDQKESFIHTMPDRKAFEAKGYVTKVQET
jgi:hypothetical protein